MKKLIFKLSAIASLILGCLFTILGLLTLILPKSFATVLSIIIIVSSVAGGLILVPIFPIFLITLCIGIITLLAPKTVSGIIMIATGISFCVVSIILRKKQKKHSV